jgi:hypothetical protein
VTWQVPIITALRFIRWVAIWYIIWTLSMMLAVALGYVLT